MCLCVRLRHRRAVASLQPKLSLVEAPTAGLLIARIQLLSIYVSVYLSICVSVCYICMCVCVFGRLTADNASLCSSLKYCRRAIRLFFLKTINSTALGLNDPIDLVRVIL